jgi:hypothetical protein
LRASGGKPTAHWSKVKSRKQEAHFFRNGRMSLRDCSIDIDMKPQSEIERIQSMFPSIFSFAMFPLDLDHRYAAFIVKLNTNRPFMFAITTK